MRSILAQGRAEVVIAMGGSEGSRLLERATGKVQQVDLAGLGRPIVDSNGAGDAFVAGFLHAHAEGIPPNVCMRMGAIAGAYACRVPRTAEEFLARKRLAAYAVA